MSKERLYIFDTTLRDGAQTQGVDFSIDDKEKISNSLEEIGQSEISSSTIGTMVMDGLKNLDPVAYVRFASVYRNFREEKDFVQFVDKIDVFKKR